ncbi:MAG: lipid-A-disaccharide synthase [Alphaproteobacteria bacterium]|nr:MAG: lipid-A-disaccharide synthase [Alphaproteobacteria bacterium]TAF15596.1 MAG: lipid-A-disaccharide synthase [Alphaproteobacteria bacterium]TAF42000.1 MAG: lipid-A-disaccharide synthase [Alphaproteobacteria bacterium]TAF76608.1 MAG: lipid-A-disaccharide synthase [Alphaproteobacteria bacterium]
MKNKQRVFIIAGEASGDVLGARLMDSLRYFTGDRLEFVGIGGVKMAEQGMRSLFPMRDIALMGFVEVLPHAWRVLCRIKETCDALAANPPDVIITIDSPGFNFRVLEWVRRYFGTSIPCIHYVAPTVWAYKQERAKRTAELCDHLLTLLPFEPRYFEVYGLKTTFVGHPVVDQLGNDCAPILPLALGTPLHLTVFPGSRRGEIQHLLPIFRDSITQLSNHYPDMHVSMIVHPMVADVIDVSDFCCPVRLVQHEDERAEVMRTTHLALTKTGTVTLEIATYGVPMVAAYHVHPLTAYMVRHLIRIPYVNLINIMARAYVIPELIQEQCNPTHLANAMHALLKHPQARQEQADRAITALHQLRNPQGILASDAAAQCILPYLA